MFCSPGASIGRAQQRSYQRKAALPAGVLARLRAKLRTALYLFFFSFTSLLNSLCPLTHISLPPLLYIQPPPSHRNSEMIPMSMLDRRASSPYCTSQVLVACVWVPISLQKTQGRWILPPHPPLHTSSWLCSSFCLIIALSSELDLKVGGIVRQHWGWTWAQGKGRLALNQHAEMASLWGGAVALPSAVLCPGISSRYRSVHWRVKHSEWWTTSHGWQRLILQQESQPHHTSCKWSRSNSIVIK